MVMTMSFVFNSKKEVSVEVKPASVEVKNGQSFSFFVRLKSVAGVHINAQPPVSVKSETEGASLTVTEIPKAGEYLDSSKPIKVECKVTGMKAGVHKLNFVVGYTYCSETEGWCRMGKDESSIEIKVKK